MKRPSVRLPAGNVRGSPGPARLATAPSPAAAGPRAALRKALAGLDSVLIYAHMNPDPDTVGAALALRLLLAERYGKKTAACYRGIIGRAENRQLMKLLADGFLHAREVDLSSFQAAFLVDCQPSYGYLADQDRLPLVGVIDHHPVDPLSSKLPFADVRPDYGSTSTILTEYLREEGVLPDARVATALFYGLKTDTQDLSRRTSAADVEAYGWLLPRIERRLLSQIENPPLTRDYYEKLVTALGRAVLYRSSVLTELGRMPYPDLVAEIADRLIRMEGIDWSVCFGLHDQRIYLSVRTVHPTRDAGELVKAVLRDEGVGGGHDTMAAGRVQLLDESDESYIRVVTELWRRFLDAIGEDPAQGRHLVSSPVVSQRIRPDARG